MNLTPELIVTLISAAVTFVIGIFTLIINHKISKINNVKDYKENNKHITPFELQFRDEEWLYDLIINRDEFDKYDRSSKKRIALWFQEYAKTHNLKKLKVNIIEQKPVESNIEPDEADENAEDCDNEEPVEINLPVGRGKVKLVNTDLAKAITEARLRNSIGSDGRIIIPKGGIREYPIEDKTIHPTPIIVDIEDVLDEENK